MAIDTVPGFIEKVTVRGYRVSIVWAGGEYGVLIDNQLRDPHGDKVIAQGIGPSLFDALQSAVADATTKGML